MGESEQEWPNGTAATTGSGSGATLFASSYRLFNPIDHKYTAQQASTDCGSIFVDGRFVFDFTALFDVALRDVRRDAEVFDFPLEQFAVGHGQAAPGGAGRAQKKDVLNCQKEVVTEEDARKEVVRNKLYKQQWYKE